MLTGGGIGTGSSPRWPAAPARDAVDWRTLDLWWGDERFLPGRHPDRNETGAREALLDHVPDHPDRVHPMPGSDGPDGPDPEAAAARYAGGLLAAAQPGGPRRGPLASTCSCSASDRTATWPRCSPAARAVRDDRTVVGVHGSPKPPPTR